MPGGQLVDLPLRIVPQFSYCGRNGVPRQREAKTSVRRGIRRWAPVSETPCRNVPSGCGRSLISEPAGGATVRPSCRAPASTSER